MTFKQIFFRIYDSKIASGEITFSRSGIKKEDFTRLCIEEDFVLDDETLDRICQTMNLTPEEITSLREAK